MRDYLSQFKRDFALCAAASIVLGLLLLLYPDTSGTILAVIIALALAAMGATHILNYLFRRFPDDIGRMDLVSGLLMAGIGVFLFFRPGVLIGVLPVVMGFLLLFGGAVKLQNAIDLARLKAPLWWVILILAALSVIAGIVVLLNPFATAELLLMFLGASLLIDGIFDIYTLITLHRRVKRFRKDLEGK